MIGFDRVRGRLLAHADSMVSVGTLPDRDALWLLSIDEAARLDDGWRPDTAWFAARRANLRDLEAYRLPDLVQRSDDVARFRTGGAAESAGTALTLRGVSLTAGEIHSVAWVPPEPGAALPAGFSPTSTILVARAVDASWIPTFAQVAGVVVETGGDLSHGSIILREIGLPAITNVAGATRLVAAGQRLRLQAGSGPVRRED